MTPVCCSAVQPEMAVPDREAVASPAIRRRLETAVVILGSLLAGAAYSWFKGEDVNWDWQNYHDYTAFALLHGRHAVDVAPAGIQSFLNPLVYLLAYLLRHHAVAPWSGMALGAIHGLNLALIHWLSRGVLGDRASRAMLTASVGIAAFGPMALSEVGTSFADILTALPVLGGLGLILGSKAGQQSRCVVAGLLIGAAVGLKLTNLIFLLAALVSLLYAAQPARAAIWLTLGAAIGALGTGGAWGFTLWRDYGNPMFPFFNSVFRSIDAPLAEIVDTRFMPQDLWDGAAYPFYWLIGEHPSSEAAFRDPRFAILVVLGAVHGCASLLGGTPRLARRDKQFLLFFVVAYLLWLRSFAIHRYAIALELLAAPLIVMLLTRLWRVMPTAAPQQRLWLQPSLVAGSAALAIALWSQPADWSRRAWTDAYRPQVSASLLRPANYLLIEKPVGYLIPLLPVGSRAYQVADILLPITPGGILDRRIRGGLADPLPGGNWALHVYGSPLRHDLLADYGLRFDSARPCERINGAAGPDIEACPLIESGRAAEALNTPRPD